MWPRITWDFRFFSLRLPRAVITGQSHQALVFELPVFNLALYQLKYDATLLEQILPDQWQKTLKLQAR